MDKNKKKQLLQEYRDRKPEMGIISFRCTATADIFIGISNEIKSGFNSNRFKLLMNSHPNKELQTLWNEHGEDQFILSVERVLKYDDPKADQTGELNKLLEECFAEYSQAKRIW